MAPTLRPKGRWDHGRMSNRRRGRTADPAPGSVAARAATGMSWVTVGALTANAASYGLHLLAGRWLHPAGYGGFANVLTVQLVIAVPALALQTVSARAVARGRDGGLVTGDTLAVDVTGLAVSPGAVRIVLRGALLAAAALPLLTVAVHVGAAPTAAALLVAPLLVLLAGVQGRWQGAERFGLLAAVLAAAGIGKVVPAVAVLALGGG